MFGKIPLAWLQLVFQKTRLLTAVAGITFAAVLMFMQFGFQEALFSTTTTIHQSIRGDLFLIGAQSENLFSSRPFSPPLFKKASASKPRSANAESKCAGFLNSARRSQRTAI
jgi:hypothetical protein